MDFRPDIPFVTHLGFRLERFEGGEALLVYTPLPEHLNTFGVIHGGVCMTLMDVCMAQAARSVQADIGVVTIEMKTSFMRPAPGDGHPVKAKGRLIHRTATMAFTEGTLYDAQDQICAHATGTFKYVKHPAAGAANGGPPGPVPTD